MRSCSARAHLTLQTLATRPQSTSLKSKSTVSAKRARMVPMARGDATAASTETTTDVAKAADLTPQLVAPPVTPTRTALRVRDVPTADKVATEAKEQLTGNRTEAMTKTDSAIIIEDAVTTIVVARDRMVRRPNTTTVTTSTRVVRALADPREETKTTRTRTTIRVVVDAVVPDKARGNARVAIPGDGMATTPMVETRRVSNVVVAAEDTVATDPLVLELPPAMAVTSEKLPSPQKS